MPRIIKSSKLGDAAILKEIIKILSKEKIKTISSLTFNPELSLKKGNFTITKPNKENNRDIDKAIRTLNRLGQYNYSQGTVVKDNKVIAIEGRGGTKAMLKKCKKFNIKNKGVLVKFPKKKQDLRIDLPTVGYKTFIQCKSAGLKGSFLKAKVIFYLRKRNVLILQIKTKCFL